MGVNDRKRWATRTTTDHDEIRRWVETRDADPAHVARTGDEDLGVLRIDFPEAEPDENLEPLAWDDFFEKFDAANLAFRYQEAKENGEESCFCRFIAREETGVTEVPDADVTAVAVGTAPVAADTDREADADSEPSVESMPDADSKPDAEQGLDADPESETDPDTDPARGSTAVGVPDEVLGRRRVVPRLTAGLVVDEIHEDARGYDHWNKNDEYLAFRYEGDEPLDLTGWTVENADGTTYEFPAGFLLEPNRPVTLHTGSGEDTDRHLYWGSPRAVWKNTGDVVTVRNDEDRRVIRVSY
ncbi:lamin tail domain-containing protein [Halorussus salinisoli]|uniref:lamin tail domain-containing protein n=1 Tax=Halorussus salinisoli TaxID=2558242 RepID=UPI0010C1E37B|nr:lamin tail domain-containing protein [Halorussus salinisoli]